MAMGLLSSWSLCAQVWHGKSSLWGLWWEGWRARWARHVLLSKGICRVDAEIAEVGKEQAVQPLRELVLPSMGRGREPQLAKSCAIAVIK